MVACDGPVSRLLTRRVRLGFWLGIVSVCECVRVLIKVESKLIKVESKDKKTLHCVLGISSRA